MVAVASAPIPIVAVVGNQLRHRWLVASLGADSRLDLRGVVVEEKRPQPRGASPVDDEVVRAHLGERAAAEARFFGDAPGWDELEAPVLRVAHGASNDRSVCEWVVTARPSILTLFGCSIVREPLLSAFGPPVNLHLGLSPYYRGAATNFWPLVNGEPECVGATVHLATNEVDGGPILRQARPEAEADDRAHELGCRAIVAGAAALADGVVLRAAGEPGRPQTRDGRLYRNADFDADAVRRLWQQLDSGLVPRYLAEKPERDAAKPIVE